MSYVQGPYESASAVSAGAPTTTAVVSSRELDLDRDGYSRDADGNPIAMRDVAQRVILAVRFGAPKPPALESARDVQTRRQDVRAALDDLVAEGAIRVVSIDVESQGAGRSCEEVTFVDRTNGEKKTVNL